MIARTVLAAAAITAALAAPVPAAASPVFTAAAKSCNLGFMPTKPTVGVGTIKGNAWAKCDVPPERHELSLALQLRVGGQWQGQRLISDSTIPAPRAVYEVSTKCVPGLWRVEAQAVGTLQGKPFNFVDHSMERFVTADDCSRGGN